MSLTDRVLRNRYRRALPNLRPVWDVLLDLVYPPRCGGCDRRGTLFCSDCLAQVKPLESAFRLTPAMAVYSVGEFGGPLREAIHKLKYESDIPLSKPLARMLYERISGTIAEPAWRDAVLVPVPLHPKSQRARGYNQSAILARELSLLSGLPVDLSLRRVRETQSQVGKTAQARRENVEGAFRWAGENVPERAILVDDVCTTGSTLVECAAALRKAGVKHIMCATVAKAVFTSSPEAADT